ncbi:hypothetical protein DFH06DRAFT_1301354 [Mycena polygramma]|nr:hypothetical protein DFH06DRAFT_1301354 [Mycena polygramma]
MEKNEGEKTAHPEAGREVISRRRPNYSCGEGESSIRTGEQDDGKKSRRRIQSEEDVDDPETQAMVSKVTPTSAVQIPETKEGDTATVDSSLKIILRSVTQAPGQDDCGRKQPSGVVGGKRKQRKRRLTPPRFRVIHALWLDACHRAIKCINTALKRVDVVYTSLSLPSLHSGRLEAESVALYRPVPPCRDRLCLPENPRRPTRSRLGGIARPRAASSASVPSECSDASLTLFPTSKLGSSSAWHVWKKLSPLCAVITCISLGNFVGVNSNEEGPGCAGRTCIECSLSTKNTAGSSFDSSLGHVCWAMYIFSLLVKFAGGRDAQGDENIAGSSLNSSPDHIMVEFVEFVRALAPDIPGYLHLLRLQTALMLQIPLTKMFAPYSRWAVSSSSSDHAPQSLDDPRFINAKLQTWPAENAVEQGTEALFNVTHTASTSSRSSMMLRR